jgi:hypothetical protein
MSLSNSPTMTSSLPTGVWTSHTATPHGQRNIPLRFFAVSRNLLIFAELLHPVLTLKRGLTPSAGAFQCPCEKLNWDVKGGEIARENARAEAQKQNQSSGCAVKFASCWRRACAIYLKSAFAGVLLWTVLYATEFPTFAFDFFPSPP